MLMTADVLVMTAGPERMQEYVEQLLRVILSLLEGDLDIATRCAAVGAVASVALGSQQVQSSPIVTPFVCLPNPFHHQSSSDSHNAAVSRSSSSHTLRIFSPI